MSRHCPEYFIQIISPWIGTAVSPFLWMWRLRPSCVTVASRIHMPAESGGPPWLSVLECREARCHTQLLSWLPGAVSCGHRMVGFCPMNHPPHTYTHTCRAVRSPQDGAELDLPCASGSSVVALEIRPWQRGRKCPEIVPPPCARCCRR